MHQMYCFLANFTELNIFVIAHFQAWRYGYVKSLLALNNLWSYSSKQAIMSQCIIISSHQNSKLLQTRKKELPQFEVILKGTSQSSSSSSSSSRIPPHFLPPSIEGSISYIWLMTSLHIPKLETWTTVGDSIPSFGSYLTQDKASYLCDPIRILLWYDFFYYVWSHVILNFFLGLLFFFAPTFEIGPI